MKHSIFNRIYYIKIKIYIISQSLRGTTPAYADSAPRHNASTKLKKTFFKRSFLIINYFILIYTLFLKCRICRTVSPISRNSSRIRSFRFFEGCFSRSGKYLYGRPRTSVIYPFCICNGKPYTPVRSIPSKLFIFRNTY